MRALLKKLESAFGTAAQIRNFGRTEDLLVDVAPASFHEVCAWLRMEESFRLDFLEAFTISEAKGKFFFTAFVRSLPAGHHLAVRTAVDVPDERAWLDFPSVSRVWPQASAFESELSPLFGIRFAGAGPSVAVSKDFGQFDGFPLRKSFTWGRELQP
jgi:NADH:ubiquinone oxidoreductase subunit C